LECLLCNVVLYNYTVFKKKHNWIKTIQHLMYSILWWTIVSLDLTCPHIIMYIILIYKGGKVNGYIKSILSDAYIALLRLK
jgi:hypothetical protein